MCGVQGQQRRSRIHGLSVTVKFKNRLSSYTLISPILRMRNFCLERWNYLASEVAREWPSWGSFPGCPAPVKARTLFTTQLLVRKKGEEKRAISIDGHQRLQTPDLENTRSGKISRRDPWGPESLVLSPEWNYIMCFLKDLSLFLWKSVLNWVLFRTGMQQKGWHMGIETTTGHFSLSCVTGTCILPHRGISCSPWKISSKEACVGITSWSQLFQVSITANYL